jgi:hypothetical protein
VAAFTRKLEVPGEHERRRSYYGRDFTLRELDEKLSKYEQRINSKEQQLREKRILLREIREKMCAFIEETQRGTSERNRLITRNGWLKVDSVAIGRKRLAALSEMALYRAQGDASGGAREPSWRTAVSDRPHQPRGLLRRIRETDRADTRARLENTATEGSNDEVDKEEAIKPGRAGETYCGLR